MSLDKASLISEQGEFVFKSVKSNMLLFPSVIQQIGLPSQFQNTQKSSYIDSLYTENLFCVVFQTPQDGLYYVYTYNTFTNQANYYGGFVTYAGMLQAGKKVVVFVDVNTVLDLTTGKTYNFTINNAIGQVIKVAPFNPQSFLIYMQTSSQDAYILYLVSILNIGGLISGTQTDFPSLNYATFVAPYTNINIFVSKDMIYLVGDEGTNVLRVHTSGILALQTIAFYPYKMSPLEMVENINADGRIGLVVDRVSSQNFLIVKNTLEDQFVFIDPSNPDWVYFGNQYWLVNPKYIYDRVNAILYNISLIPTSTPPVNVKYRYSKRIRAKGVLKSFKYAVRQEYTIAPFFINVHYTYRHLYNSKQYICSDEGKECFVNVVGDMFLIDVLPVQPTIFDDFIIDLVEQKE